MSAPNSYGSVCLTCWKVRTVDVCVDCVDHQHTQTSNILPFGWNLPARRRRGRLHWWTSGSLGWTLKSFDARTSFWPFVVASSLKPRLGSTSFPPIISKPFASCIVCASFTHNNSSKSHKNVMFDRFNINHVRAAAPPHNVNPTNPVMPGSFDLLASVFLSLSLSLFSSARCCTRCTFGCWTRDECVLSRLLLFCSVVPTTAGFERG